MERLSTDIAHPQLIPPVLYAATTLCTDGELTSEILLAVKALLQSARNVKMLNQLPDFMSNILEWSMSALLDSCSTSHAASVQLVAQLFATQCSALDIRKLWKLLLDPKCPETVYEILPFTGRQRFSGEVWEFVTASEYQKDPCCCVALAETTKRTWPPHNCTMLWWLRIISYSENNFIHLFHACPYDLNDGPDLVSAMINGHTHTLMVSMEF